jgi:hypothetical protein
MLDLLVTTLDVCWGLLVQDRLQHWTAARFGLAPQSWQVVSDSMDRRPAQAAAQMITLN